jgi:glycosyltransferase involved in cell wall biosynthesis
MKPFSPGRFVMTECSVAHVSRVIGGGMGTVFRVLLPAQVRRGHRVTFFAREVSAVDADFFRDRQVEMRTASGVFSLARELREFDVVHMHSADLDLLLAGWLSGRPTIFTLHGLRAQTRPVSTLVRQRPTLAGVRRRFKRLALCALLRYSVDQVTTVSRFLADRAIVQYGIGAGKVIVIHSGIELDRYQPADCRRLDERMVIGWVGRMVPVKRLHLLLQAAAPLVLARRFPGLRILLVGDGPLRAELLALSVSLGIASAVEFVGFVDEPERYYADMDLFVFPSREEGAGLVINEAMASKVPVLVLADGGGAVELVAQSGGGVVTTEASLAADLQALLGDEERRRALAEKGAAYALRELDPAAWAERFDRVYRGRVASSS